MANEFFSKLFLVSCSIQFTTPYTTLSKNLLKLHKVFLFLLSSSNQRRCWRTNSKIKCILIFCLLFFVFLIFMLNGCNVMSRTENMKITWSLVYWIWSMSRTDQPKSVILSCVILAECGLALLKRSTTFLLLTRAGHFRRRFWCTLWNWRV